MGAAGMHQHMGDTNHSESYTEDWYIMYVCGKEWGEYLFICNRPIQLISFCPWNNGINSLPKYTITINTLSQCSHHYFGSLSSDKYSPIFIRYRNANIASLWSNIVAMADDYFLSVIAKYSWSRKLAFCCKYLGDF